MNNVEPAVSFLSARLLILASSLLLQASTQAAAAQGGGSSLVDKICPLIESSARTNSLPVDFFTRLIWQESRFQPDVIGLATKGGQRAEGIAQFMPATAAEHNLIKPFNPIEALPKSGEFLAQLRNQFGNLGLAAAAYNAGPKRVQDYLAGIRALPTETRKYVLTITGKPVQAWTQPVTEQQNRTNTSDPHSEAHNLNCQGIVANLEQVSAPNFGKPGSAAQLKRNLPSGLLARLEETSKAPNPGKPRLAAQLNRNVPSWCRGLQHPNVSECGDVHMPSSSAKSNIVLGPPVRAHPPRMRNLKMALFH